MTRNCWSKYSRFFSGNCNELVRAVHRAPGKPVVATLILHHWSWYSTHALRPHRFRVHVSPSCQPFPCGPDPIEVQQVRFDCPSAGRYRTTRPLCSARLESAGCRPKRIASRCVGFAAGADPRVVACLPFLRNCRQRPRLAQGPSHDCRTPKWGVSAPAERLRKASGLC